MAPMSPCRPRLRPVLFGLLLAPIALLTLAPAVSAHGDVGIFAVDVDGRIEADTVTYEVVLSFENDGDPVDGAVVTATATPSDGGQPVSATLASTGAPGTYTTTLTLRPGTFAVTIASEDPAARIERSVTIPAATPTTTAPVAISPQAPTTTAARDASGDASVSADDDSSSAIVIGAVVLAALGLVAAGLTVARRRP